MVARVRLVSTSDHSAFRRNGDGHEQVSIAAAFLQKLRPGGPWILTGIVPDGRTETITARSAAEVDAFVRRINGKENIYYAVNPVRRKKVSSKARKTDVAAIEFLLADLDPRDGESPDAAKQRYLTQLEEFDPKPSAVVDSGSGVQCLWMLKKPVRLGEPVRDADGKLTFGPEDRRLIENIEGRTAALMRSLGAKAGTQNIDRILRLPGTVNLPTAAKRKKGRVACEAKLLWFENTTHLLDAFPAEGTPKRAPNSGKAKRSGAAGDGEEDELARTIADGGGDRHGGSRSEAVYYVVHEMLRRRCADRIILSVLLDRGNGISEHVFDQPEEPEAYAKRQIAQARMKRSSGGDDSDAAGLLEELNRKYAIVRDGGNVMVYADTIDNHFKRQVWVRIKIDEFKLLLKNRIVRVGTAANGAPICKPAADFWMAHPDRRQYLGGMSFITSGRVPADQLNLWRGYGFEPKEGCWDRLKEHTHEVLCRGNDRNFEFLMNWSARLVQHPDELGMVAVVLRGEVRTGKGTLGHALRKLMGQHGLHISTSTHLVGKHNAHLRDCALLFADEAFFAGDRAHVGTLKALLTEPVLMLEPKFRDAVQAPNHLHVFMGSNNTWVIPAAIGEERFFMQDVSSKRQGQHQYFRGIYEELNAGGYAAMLHELLHRPIDGHTDKRGRAIPAFEVRDVPRTRALQEQQKLSLDTHDAWWFEVLSRGFVFKSTLGLEEYFGEWRDFMTTEVLFASYQEFAKGRNERQRLSHEALGRFMAKLGCRYGRARSDDASGEHRCPNGCELYYKDRAPGYYLGSLEEARADFVERKRLPSTKWES